MPADDALIQLDALGPAGSYRSRNRLTLPDVSGVPMAELSLVPRLFVHRCLAALRKAPTKPVAERMTALTAAAQTFETGVVNGLSRDDYEHAVSRVSGMPISVVHASTESIARHTGEALQTVQYARPNGATDHWSRSCPPTTRLPTT